MALKIVRLALICTLASSIPLYAVVIGLRSSAIDAWQGVSDFERLRSSSFPIAHIVKELEQRLAAGECALLFRQSDFSYYGRGCYFSHLDSRLIPLYVARDSETIRRFLRAMRIRYVYLPSYGTPEHYNTALEAFLADPTNAAIVWELNKNRLFEVRAAEPAAAPARRELLSFGADWRLRNSRGQFTHTLKMYDWSIRRDYLTTGGFVPDAMPVYGWDWSAGQPCTKLLSEARLRALEIEVAGKGYLLVHGLESGAVAGIASLSDPQQALWDGAVTARRMIRAQYVAQPGQCAMARLKFSLLGNGSLEVISGKVYEYPDAIDESMDFARQRAELAGWTARAKNYAPVSWKWGLAAGGEVETYGYEGIAATPQVASPPMYLASERGPLPAATPIDISLSVRGHGEAEISVQRLIALPPGLITRILRQARVVFENLGLDTPFPPRFSRSSGPYAPELVTQSESIVRRIGLSDAEAVVHHSLDVEDADAIRVVVRLLPSAGGQPPGRVGVTRLEAHTTYAGTQRRLYRFARQDGH